MCTVSLVSTTLPPTFEPVQLGFSPGGSERAAHLLQACAESGGLESIILKTDVKNAFNEIHRSAFMGKLFTKGVLGPIWRLAHWAYSQPSSLFVIDKGTLFTSLLSCEGVQQGDGLAGLLFSLGIHDSYLASLSSVTDVSGVAVMDDFYLEGPYGGVLQAFDRYSTAESKKVGLSLRSEKCIAFWVHQADPPQPLLDGLKNRGIRLVRDTLECLGTVIGLNHAAMSQWAYDRITSPSHLQLFSTLLNPSLPVQAAMAILRLCAIPRMSYLSRTLKPAIVTKAGAYFDSKVFDTASTKLRLPSNLTPGARLSLTLPIRLGGFGLRSVVRTSYASYWSGLAQAAPDILSRIRRLPPPSLPPASPSSIPPPPPPSASSPPPTIP